MAGTFGSTSVRRENGCVLRIYATDLTVSGTMEKALRAIVDAHYDKCVARVIYRLRRVSAKDWDGAYSGLRTLWDHWKREMQEDESLIHDLLEDMVEASVRHVVEQLSNEDGALMTLVTSALDDLDEGQPREPLFAPDAVAEELMGRVNSRACDEPHREEVQRQLDKIALDRFREDIEPYQ
jgi:hypothetical protein